MEGLPLFARVCVCVCKSGSWQCAAGSVLSPFSHVSLMKSSRSGVVGRGVGAAEGGKHGGRKGPGAKKYYGAKEAAKVFSFRLKTNKRIVESKICSGGVKEEGGAVAH